MREGSKRRYLGAVRENEGEGSKGTLIGGTEQKECGE